MGYVLKAVLSSAQHPEYGQITVPCSEREWLDAAQYLTGHDCASALEARNRLVR